MTWEASVAGRGPTRWRRLRWPSCGAVALLAVAVIVSPRAIAQSLHPAAFLPLSAAVVRVEGSPERGIASIGSGVTVAPQIVVTNCHVTRGAAAIRISGAGQIFDVTAEHADGTHDVCFLQVPGWQGKPVDLAPRDDLRIGAPVAAIGFTGGMGRSLQFGRVRGLHTLEGARVIQSDAAFTSGASGGGLFDAHGRLVGLLTFRSREAPRTGYYALPVQWIRDRLPRGGEWEPVHPLADAAPFWERDPVTQPFFMRAASLDAERRWPELIELTSAWAKADPDDAEPFRFRGSALQALDRADSAVYAFNEALRLAPDDPRSWFGLARAYASIGDDAASQQAESKVADLDEDLATSLRDEIEHATSR